MNQASDTRPADREHEDVTGDELERASELAALAGVIGALPPRPDPGRSRVELAAQLLAAWTFGRPGEVDEVMMMHAVKTVGRLVELTAEEQQ